MNYNRNLFQQINRLTNEVTGSYRSYTPPEPPVPVTDTVTITTQPTDITCYIGDTATLSIVAVSDDETATLSYQWQILDNETWLNVSGATSSSYVVPTSGIKEDSYRCQVTSDKGGSATSTTATVTVQAVPVDIITISAQPQSVTCYLNDTASISVTATSDDATATLSYQWQVYDGSSWSDVTGATSSTYTIPTTATMTKTYRCMITSDKGGSAVSNGASVQVTTDTISITAQPQSASGYVNDTITLSVTASSNAQGATLSYQWQIKNGSTYDDITGATSNTYTVSTATVGTERYRVLVTSDKGGTATSNYADITIAEKPQLFLVRGSDSSESVDSDAYFNFDTIVVGKTCYISFMDDDINTAVARGTSKGITSSVNMPIPGVTSSGTGYRLASISRGSGKIYKDSTAYSQNSVKLSASASASGTNTVYFRNTNDVDTRHNNFRLWPVTYGGSIGTITVSSSETTHTVTISSIASSAVSGAYTMCDVYLYIIDGGLNVVTSAKKELNNCPTSTTIDIDVSMLSSSTSGAFKAVGFCVQNSQNVANSGSYCCKFFGAVNVIMQY